MPNEKIDVATKYTHYFNISAPSATLQVLVLLVLGAAAGALSGYIIHGNTDGFVVSAAAAGILIITLPAILTAILIKSVKPRMHMKHPLFAALTVSIFYAIAIVVVAIVYSVLNRYDLASVLLILSDAGMYGYWFFIDKIAIGQRKGAIVMAAAQPVLNILFYIPLGKYIFAINTPLNMILLKLYAGMIVFLAVGYAIVYLLDRPAKKALSISGLAVFTAMVQQWLLDINPGADFLGDTGVSRDMDVEVLVLSRRKNPRAVFIKPDMHYGPFANVGGSIAPEQLGKLVVSKYKATPFIMHGTVSACDNPVSTSEVYVMKRHLNEYISGLIAGPMRKAVGSVAVGKDGNCRAVNIGINDMNIITLSKAPLVTEDIERGVGISLTLSANKNRSKVMLVDAHNSRFESASPEELRGIHQRSKYVEAYRNAILRSMKKTGNGKSRLLFGSSYAQMRTLLAGKRDMGWGYASVGVFQFGKKRFSLVYFDSNNMLPGFRKEIVDNVRKKFGMDTEVCTTDTHSVNSIALSASNALGRETRAREVIPILDKLFVNAIDKLEPVSVAYGTTTIKDFKVWGIGADEMLKKAGKDAIHILKHTVPVLAVCGFVVAAWVIYII